MSFKLIREAHLRTTLSADDIKALSIIKDATGKDTLAELLAESFTPSADDFETWMRVVVGSAEDYPELSISKKKDFLQIAMDVLEQDPGQPPIGMQEMIAKKLWQDYNSARDTVRINKLAQANEEEERVQQARQQIADRYAKGPTPVTPSYDEEESGLEQALKLTVGVEDEEPSFLRDVLRTSSPASLKGSFSSHLRGEEVSNDDELELDDELDDEFRLDSELETNDGECKCPINDEESADADSVDALDSKDVDTIAPPADEFDDETMDDIDADVEPRTNKKGFDEEEAVKSFFRQAVTSPNDMMRQAVKDIEGEGKSAWSQTNMPTNPHPKKSQAHRAWQKGLMTAAKEALGIVDKPGAPKAKPGRKK